MPSVQIQDLYLAKSLSELQEKAHVNEDSLSSRSAIVLSSSAVKLFLEAMKLVPLDEEKAYVLLFRCLNTVDQLRKKAEGRSDKMFERKKQVEALSILEKLSGSLEMRYQLKSEEQDARYRQKFSPLNGNVLTPTIKPEEKNNSKPKDDKSIGAMELYDLMQDKGTGLIIFDCRPSEEFNESHINHPSCVNIPAEVLKPGITAATLGASLDGEAKSLWNKRALVDFVVLLDDDSSCKNMIPHGPLNSLNLAISKWDIKSVLKRDPLILDNGFHEWVMHYPTTVTKAPALSAVSMNNIEFQNSIQFIDVEYPDLDDITAPANKELLDTAFHELLTPTQSNENVQKPAFYVEKNLNGQFGSGPATQAPTIDRKSKPKSSPVPKPKNAWDEITQDQGSMESDAGSTQSAFDALRQRRMMEASATMLEEVQRKEEKLLQDLQASEEHNRFLQEKSRMDEEEKERLKKKLQKEAEEKTNKLQKEEQEKKKHLDSEVERSRQERKRREKLEKEADQLRLALHKQTLDDKRGPADTASPPVHISQSSVEEPPTPPSVPGRPSTASASKPTASVPSVPPKKWPESNAGVYTAKLKDEGESSSKGSLSRSLSRSHSSPDIAQLLADEDQKAPLRPLATPDKLFKPNKLTEDCFPNINRALKPVDNTNTTRMRNFSPVFSSQPNTPTGLKNLGNTCFMNSVLQCLSHTQTLVAYLNSGAYLKDINRTYISGGRGVVIQELASVFQNLYQKYRNISPHEFKNTVSRHIAVCEGYDQQDAHEFLVVLTEKLHMETNKGGSSKGLKPPDLDKVASAEEALNHFWVWHLKLHNSYFVNTFEGVLQSKLTCSVCSHHAYTYEVFSCLSLPIPSHNKCSLKDCIQSLLKAETIRGEAGWKCPICKRKQEAEKEMALCRLPPILIIHLKRFSYEGLWRRKLATSVDFPLTELDMQPYLIVPTKKSKYNLYGVVNHYGTLEGGHYTAFCRNEKWFNFDDHEVQQIATSSVKTSAAYILFYASV